MADVDYIGLWFKARKRFGIEDLVSWGWYDPDADDIEWQHAHHAERDGAGIVADGLRRKGYPCRTLPHCSFKAEPSWWEIFAARRKHPKPPVANTQINWRRVYECHPGARNEAFTTMLSADEVRTIKKIARTERVTYGNYMFAVFNQVMAKQLIQGDEPYYWFFPVNVRGAVNVPHDHFNQASGIYLAINPNSSAREWQAQLKLRIARMEHWSNWKLAHIGRFIGEKGLAWIYKKSSAKVFYIGNCTHMGRWPLPEDDNPPRRDKQIPAGCSPGTRNYPVGISILEWYDEMSLSLRVHPALMPNPEDTRPLLLAWKKALLAPAANLPQRRPRQQTASQKESVAESA